MADSTTVTMLDALAQGATFGVASSLHCIGMCGPFAGYAGRRVTEAGLYHSGRALGYATIGGVAGMLGYGFSRSVGAGSDLAFGAALASLVFGSALLLRGILGPHGLPLPKIVGSFGASMIRPIQELPANLRAGALGVLTALLPCGVLYAAFLAAAASASPLLGSTSLVGLALGAAPALLLAQLPAGRFLRKPGPARGLALVAGATLVYRAIMAFQTGVPSCCEPT